MKKILAVFLILMCIVLTGCEKTGKEFKDNYEKLNGQKTSYGTEYRTVNIDENNKIVFSTPKEVLDMINKGEWMTTEQPHLPKSLNEYNKQLRIVFWYKKMKFIGELLLDKKTNDIAWFIYPYEGEIDNNTIVVSDVIKPTKYYQRDIYNLSIGNDRLRSVVANTFREQNIFYATDLTGCEFKQVIDFIIRR